MKMKYVVLTAIFLCALIVRIYRLYELPGEWYGDISNVHEYVQEILTGIWPFYFFQSPGPLYHYVIAPIAALYYRGYLTYKLASIGISFIGLIGIYTFVKEIASQKIAFITISIASPSLWFLIFSRLGNSQIIIPVLSSFMLATLIRFYKTGKTNNLYFGIFIASSGWYTYPQTFIFVPFYFLFFISYLLYKRHVIKYRKTLLLLVVEACILFYPFLTIVQKQWNDFTAGYIGSKIFVATHTNNSDFLTTFTGYFSRSVLMLYTRGDGIFRHNIPGRPQLDIISGILLLVGTGILIFKKRWYFLVLLLFAYSFFILPALSPAISSGEVPSSSRTIAVIPIVYTLVGYGMWSVFSLLKNKLGVLFAASAVVLIGGAIWYQNMFAYFVTYAKGLPEQNLGPSNYIAHYIDTEIIQSVSVYFGSCCWGEWGEPEPKAVYYNLLKKRKYVGYNKVIDTCDEVTNFPAIILFGKNGLEKMEKFQTCFEQGSLSTITLKDDSISLYQLFVP